MIALNAHGDVVPPGEGWTVDPYGAVERDGALYGRGVAVSKSDFATYAFALLALEANSAGLDGGIELHFTYDEEAGGMIGPKWLIDQRLTKATLAISAGFSYAITTAHNGVPPSRSHRARQAGPRGDARDRRRRAGGDRAGAGGDLRRAEATGRQRQPREGHRLAADHGRADLRRHQHQRRAGPHCTSASIAGSFRKRTAPRSRRPWSS